MVTSKGVGLAVPGLADDFRLQHVFLPGLEMGRRNFFRAHSSPDRIGHRIFDHHPGDLAWRSRKWSAGSRSLGWASLGAVVLQGVLGGLRVTLLKDEIGIFHACLAQAFSWFARHHRARDLAALAPTRALRRRGATASLAILALVISGLIYGQLGLGATMRHQHRDLSIMDFPLAYGQIIPATDSATIARINQARDAQAFPMFRPDRSGCKWRTVSWRALIGLAIAAFWLLVRRERIGMSFLRSLCQPLARTGDRANHARRLDDLE